jgi:hypothetical protein
MMSPFVGNGNHLQRGPSFLAQHLPGHNVGVVLHVGDDDLIPGLDEAAAEGRSHQVDALGCPAGKDDLFAVARIDELPYRFTGCLVFSGGFLSQGVNTPVNVGVVTLVIRVYRLNHGAWLLGGSRIIEVHQRLAVDRLVQDREILADAGNVISSRKGFHVGEC